MDPQDRVRQIEAEMARFETEIGGGHLIRAGGLTVPNINSLPFLPHSVRMGPLPPRPPQPPQPPPLPMMLPPPPPLIPPPPPSAPAAPHHAMAAEIARSSEIDALPSPATGPVIEAGPTKYLPSGTLAAAASGIPRPKPLDEAAKKKRKAEEMEAGTSRAGPVYTSQVLRSDVEAVEHNKKQKETFDNSFIGQVLSGKKKMKRFLRTGGGTTWEDTSLAEWDPNDFRLFCGDLGNEVSDELLAKAFRQYPSFQKAKVVRDKRTNKTKGFGFVSFKDPQDYIRAMREMNGKYVGNRPIKLRKSEWKERSLDVVRKKNKIKQKLGYKV